jgi:uncharacterized protein YebE (UPF0316 family)
MCLTIAALLPSFSFLPFLVFFAELCVVTLSTLRIIFISRGMRILAPTVGFFEVTIWLFAIGQVMQNLHDARCFLGFACGFTLGNYFGMVIESWLALGTVVVRTITHRNVTDLIQRLREAHFGVTCMDAQGSKGPVKVVFTVVRRKELGVALGHIRRFDPRAFYSVDEIRDAESGIFAEQRRLRGAIPDIFQPFRKAA